MIARQSSLRTFFWCHITMNLIATSVCSFRRKFWPSGSFDRQESLHKRHCHNNALIGASVVYVAYYICLHAWSYMLDGPYTANCLPIRISTPEHAANVIFACGIICNGSSVREKTAWLRAASGALQREESDGNWRVEETKAADRARTAKAHTL